MAEKSESWQLLLRIVTPFFLLSIAKFLYASYVCDTLFLSSAWLAASFACLLFTASLVVVIPGRWSGAFVATGLSLGLSALLLVDVAYYRFFEDLPTIMQAQLAGQLGDVGGSVWHSLRLSDIVLFLDLPLYLWLAKSRIATGPKLKMRLASAAILALIAAGLSVSLESLKSPLQKSVEARLFKNYAIGREFGLFYYHARDLGVHFSKSLQSKEPPKDLSPLLVAPRRALQSITADTEYRGVAQKMNVLVLMLESWQSFAVDLEVDGQKLMPFMSSYKERCLYFDRVFDQTNVSSSADGEFIFANSLHPAGSGSTPFVYEGNAFYGLPTALANSGYWTAYFGYYDGGFWNARTMVPAYGYKETYFAPFGEPPHPVERVGWGLSDLAVLKRVQKILEERESPEPFFVLAECSMGHHPFKELSPEQQMLQLPQQMQGTLLGDYLQICRFRDLNLAKFLTDFEQSPLAGNTMIVLVADHAPATKPEELAPILEQNSLSLKARWLSEQTIPLMIKLPNGMSNHFGEPISQLDIGPTLSHLLGVAPEHPVFFGQNAFVREGPFFARKHGIAVDWPIVVSVLDRKAYDFSQFKEIEIEPHAALVEAALEEWQVSDLILDLNLIQKLREQLKEES